MEKKYFPIRNDTACQLKWNWSTLLLSAAKTASCHRTGWGILTPENFDNFHNTEKKQQERTKMLNGQWPVESCGYCREIEKVGGVSDRMVHLDIPNQVPPELEHDPTAVVVSPTILEVFFNNTCNLACLYCLPWISSKIYQENVKFGDFQSRGVSLQNNDHWFDSHSEYINLGMKYQLQDYSSLLEKFWIWMKNNSHSLRRFNLLGGEPFYQAEFGKILEFFENKPHPDLEFNVTTNLMVSPDKLDKFVTVFRSLLAKKHLKRIDITCSIDCWGPEQEYVRYGLNLEIWEKNFLTLLQQKWLTININQTISVLTIKTMPELLTKLSYWRNLHPVGHYFSAVSPQPQYLMPHIMGKGIFQEDFDRILNLMPTDTQQDQTALKYMQGIRDQIENSQPDLYSKSDLKVFLDEKDRRRGNSWRKTFPWLVQEIDHVV